MEKKNKFSNNGHFVLYSYPVHRKGKLFGKGQTYGTTFCDLCGAFIQRHSGSQRYCCAYYGEPGSCSHKAILARSHQQRVQLKMGVTHKNHQYKLLKNKTGKPSPILMCRCGRCYIKTRIGQVCCLFCIKQYEYEMAKSQELSVSDVRRVPTHSLEKSVVVLLPRQDTRVQDYGGDNREVSA